MPTLPVCDELVPVALFQLMVARKLGGVERKKLVEGDVTRI